jgi:hypothetical protein
MDPGPSSPQGSDKSIRDSLIQPGDSVLLKLPNGDVRSVKVDADVYGTENQCGQNVLIISQDDYTGTSRVVSRK